MIIQMIYYNQIELPDNSIGGREIKQKIILTNHLMLLFDIVIIKVKSPIFTI